MASANADEAIKALGLILTSGVESADWAARAMGEIVAREIRAQLGKSSHAPGTPSPSPPGEPPAMVSGRLRDSVSVKELKPGVVQVGAVTAYARIQEMGGRSGRGGATELPSRSYMVPAWDRSKVECVDAALEIISEAIRLG